MNPKSFLSKSTSVIATLLLAVGGSLIATQPASAADSTGAAIANTMQATSTSISLSFNGCTLNGFPNPVPTLNGSDFAVTVNSVARTVTNVGLGGFLTLTLASALAGGDQVSISYTQPASTSNRIPCQTASSYVASFSALTGTVPMPQFTVTLDANNSGQGNNASPNFLTQASAGASVSLPTTTGVPTKVGCTLRGWAVDTTNATNAVLVSNTYTPSSNLTLYASWLCSAGGPPMNTSAPAITGTAEVGSTLTAGIGSWSNSPTAYTYQWRSCSASVSAGMNVSGCAAIPGATSSTYVIGSLDLNQYITVRVAASNSSGPSQYFAASTSAIAAGSGNAQNNIVTATVERSIPTPVFQAPILNSIAPKMSAGFSSNGGRLVLKDVKPTDITSVTLNGKTVAVVPSKSGAALRIPAGAGAGDLKFTMADGTVIDVPNAVKITVSQVDPKLVDLNNLPTFKAGSVAVPSTIKKALLKNKEVILDSANAKCVGYATSNTAAARATALSRASNVCGIITDMNENIEPLIKVLVNKVVAKKSPVKYQTW